MSDQYRRDGDGLGATKPSPGQVECERDDNCHTDDAEHPQSGVPTKCPAPHPKCGVVGAHPRLLRPEDAHEPAERPPNDCSRDRFVAPVGLVAHR